MRTLPKNISAHPDGYLVRIVRRELKWSAFVPYSFGGGTSAALAEAVRLRDRYYQICGPITRRTPRSNTDVVGISETTHWHRGREHRNFIVHIAGRNRRFYYGRQRTRGDAFQLAVNHRAQALGVQPATLLPQWP